MPRGFIIFIAFLVVILARESHGDTVYLTNGDHFSGDLQEIKEGVVAINTAYAGVIRIQQGQIDRIETMRAMNVLLKNGTELDGTLEYRRGESGVRTDSGWQATPLADVSSVRVAPAPADISGEHKDTRAWSGTVDTGLEMRRGNTDTTEFNLSTTVTGRKESDVLTLRGSGAYSEAGDILNTRKYQGEGKWQVYPRDRLYLYGLAGGEHDDGRKLDLRAQTGAGVGYDFVENKKQKLSADVGLTYTYERWNPYTPQERETTKIERRVQAAKDLGAAAGALGGKGDALQALVKAPEAIQGLADPLHGAEQRTEEFANVRASAQYEHSVFERSKLSENFTILPNLEELGEYRFTSDLAFTTPLSKELGLRMNFKNEYDSLADERGVEAWDSTLQTGLHYEFGASRKSTPESKSDKPTK